MILRQGTGRLIGRQGSKQVKVCEASRPGGGSRTGRQSSCLEPGLTGGCGADSSMPVCCDGRRGTRQKSRWLVVLAASVQYSPGNSRVVADRSASVIIHSLSPASVW